MPSLQKATTIMDLHLTEPSYICGMNFVTCATFISTGASVPARCLALVSQPSHISKLCRLPQTVVFIEVAVCGMRWSRWRGWLRWRWWTLEFIFAISTVLLSVTLPVDIDAQVVCTAVKLVTGALCSTCWCRRNASLNKKIAQNRLNGCICA